MTVIKEIAYPHIASHPGIGAGTPIIDGTRTTVRCLAGYYQMGMTVDEILQALPHLSAAQVHSGLAYYFDHQDEIDRDRAENEDVEHWSQQVLSHSKAKVGRG